MSYMYSIDVNDPEHRAEGLAGIHNAVFTTIAKAHEMLLSNGFVLVAQGGTWAYTKGDILAVICKTPVNPILGKEEVQLR